MAQRDVEIDFMSRAYKNLTEQISEKLFFNAALGNVLSLFTHNAHRQHGRSCACVGNDKYRKKVGACAYAPLAVSCDSPWWWEERKQDEGWERFYARVELWEKEAPYKNKDGVNEQVKQVSGQLLITMPL